MRQEIIGAALIIFGWIIVHFLSSCRELSKIKADLAVKLVQRVSDLESCVIKYHTNENRDSIEEVRLMSAFSEVSADISFVGCFSEATAEAYIAFRKRSMLENFRTAKFSQQIPNSDFILDIASAALDLRSALKSEIGANLLSPKFFGGFKFGRNK